MTLKFVIFQFGFVTEKTEGFPTQPHPKPNFACTQTLTIK